MYNVFQTSKDMPDSPGEINHILVFILKQPTVLSLWACLTVVLHSSPTSREAQADKFRNTADTLHMLIISVNGKTKLLCCVQRQLWSSRIQLTLRTSLSSLEP